MDSEFRAGTSPIERVLVTGGGTFLGDNIAAALLAEGVEVSLLVRPASEDRLGALKHRVRWWTADIWNPASLKGRARGQQVVIHTVGGMNADPAQGLTHHYLNVISTRNIANLCINSGVPHMVLMSAARAPWTSSEYIASKREAEDFVDRVGLKHTVIRAPITYVRGARRALFWQLMTLLGGTPPLSWLAFGKIAPMPIDVLARGVARIALDPRPAKTVYYARDLRRRNSQRELHRVLPLLTDDVGEGPNTPLSLSGEDIPFGWTPYNQDE
ncbi:MAG: SDR family oxidoreductase [Anaerolineae bacterium]|nr:SDR family oxidoreductase [Anaerolineae bacterium]